MKAGTVSEYQSTTGNYSSTILTQRQFINGVETTVQSDSDGDIAYYTNDEKGLRLHKSESPTEGGVNVVVYNPPLKLANAQIVVGGSLLSQGVATMTDPGFGIVNVNYSSNARVIGLEDITTSAGTFSQTIHLQYTVFLSGTILGYNFSSDAILNIWFVEDIGAVKSDSSQTIVLESFGSEVDIYSDFLTNITIPQTPAPLVIQRNSTTGVNLAYNLLGASVTSQSQVNIVADLDWDIAGTGDFNSDGEKDLLWRNSTTGENYIYFMNGYTIVNNLHVNTISNTDWEVVGIADFDADGKDDILWRHKTNGSVWMYLMDGATIKNSLHVAFTGLDWEIKGTGDFDGDGKGDILWRNKLYGRVWMYLMDGATIQTNSHVAHSGSDWDIKDTGDFNADGKEDILWRNSATGQNWMYLMNGTQITQDAYVNTLTDLNWEVVNTQDFNGDNRTDVLWRHAITGENLLYQMNGSTIMDARTVGLSSNQVSSQTHQSSLIAQFVSFPIAQTSE